MKFDFKFLKTSNFTVRKALLWLSLVAYLLVVVLASATTALRLKGRQRYPEKPTRKPTLRFDSDIDRNSSHERVKFAPPDFDGRRVYKIPKQPLYVGIVLPKSNFRYRDYYREIGESFLDTPGSSGSSSSSSNTTAFADHYKFTGENVVVNQMEASSSPTKILATLCEEFVMKNVSAILYLSSMETFGRATASVQYFFQLASYLGLPVISWNADNSGLERRSSSLQLQLAPSIEHQVSAMLSILRRYSWPKFAVITTHIAGHNDFIQAVRDAIQENSRASSTDEQEFTLIDTVIIGDHPHDDLRQLISSEARIYFLYCTRDEGVTVLTAATEYGLTGSNYLWIVTQSVIQSLREAPKGYTVGMLGVHFGTSDVDMISEIRTSMRVFRTGVQNYVEDSRSSRGVLPDMNPALSCDSGAASWKNGANFYRFLKEVKISDGESKLKQSVEFNSDGTRKFVQLKIMNLRQDVTKQLVWEEIGIWNSGKKDGLEVKDIVWPGYSHVPPNGIPEKFHLKVTFMEEPPFINMDNPNPLTGRCAANKGILCRIATDEMMQGVNVSWAMRNGSYFKCCSGFCIDLLVKFSQDLGFSYDFFRVEDGIWGAIVNGKWTGLPGAIINGKADMIMTSIKINSQREEVLDFSIPFLDTGITIVVSKRTGIISPTAFLEPFDTASWMLVAAVAIQVAAFSIFIFEWLSPSGFNMKFHPPTGQRFSLLRTVWLVWAILFQAAVNIDVPRSVTSRVMGNVWAMFALIFLAIYTANLAAFMITREEYYDLSGVEDKRLQNPRSVKPAFKFATTLHGNTDVLLKKSFPEMHRYMRMFNRTSPIDGVKAVKKGELDAFLYDATVLEYLTGQDDECRLVTVGSWYALAGYGVAFRRNSKYIPLFNEQIMKYHESGYLERLTRFWFTGACQGDLHYKTSSKPLALEQFISTFVLLGCGVILGLFILLLEHVYFKYVRFRLSRCNIRNFFSLISMSMGSSLLLEDETKRGAIEDRRSKCEDPVCDMQLWKVKHDLDFARLRIYYLERQLISSGIWKNPRKRKKEEGEKPRSSSRDRKSPQPKARNRSPVSHAKDTPSTKRSPSKSTPSKTRGAVNLEPQYLPVLENRFDGEFNEGGPSPLRRRDMTKDVLTSTELIRKPLVGSRLEDLEVAEKETVL